MRLIIIRHADPDYSIDSLTEKGWREAELLSKKLVKMYEKDENNWHFYVSCLGRAQDTANVTLKKIGRTAEVHTWLREFDAPITTEDGRKRIPWDFIPEYWTAEEDYFHKDRWMDVKLMADGDVGTQFKWVADGLDAILARHGYRRDGNLYRADQASNDTVVMFCHFGVECVLLSHLLGISPLVLWHGTCAAPSSVTTLVTEERRKGTAFFRMSSFGDISHLYAGDEPPAFAARFCECFDNLDERHD